MLKSLVSLGTQNFLLYPRRSFQIARCNSEAASVRDHLIALYGETSAKSGWSHLWSYHEWIPIRFPGFVEFADAWPGMKYDFKQVKYIECLRSYSSPGYKKNFDLVLDFKRKTSRWPRRPKHPKLLIPYSRKIITPPTLKLYVEREFTPPKGKRALRVWPVKLLSLQQQEKAKAARVNARRRSEYERRLALYNEACIRRDQRLAKVNAINKSRLSKFDRRMAHYEAAVKSRVERPWTRRWVLKRNASAYLISNPYLRGSIVPDSDKVPAIVERKSEVANVGDARNFLGWSSDPRPMIVTYDITRISYVNYSYELEDLFKSLEADLVSACVPDQLDIERRLNGKIDKNKVEIGNIIAERAQTYGMIKSSIAALLLFVKGKKAIFTLKSTLRKPKFYADSYLAFKFGVQPLYNDLIGLRDQAWNDSLPVVSAKTGVHRTGLIVGSAYEFTGVAIINYTLKYTLDDGLQRRLAQLGLVNPDTIAWEVCPWSFVVDWLLPVGRFIQSLESTLGLSFLSFDRVVTFKGQVKYRRPGGDDMVLLEAVSSLPILNVSMKVRSQLAEPPPFFFPTLKNPLSLTHGLESLSLLVQKLVSKR